VSAGEKWFYLAIMVLQVIGAGILAWVMMRFGGAPVWAAFLIFIVLMKG
jgi:hypothetical protein